MAEPFLPNGHRCPKCIEQCGVTVPEGMGCIQRGEMVPLIRKNPGYLANNDLQIVDRKNQPVPWNPQDPPIDRLASGEFRLRQQPGTENSLGSSIFRTITPSICTVPLRTSSFRAHAAISVTGAFVLRIPSP